jgi:hypothetical protein
MNPTALSPAFIAWWRVNRLGLWERLAVGDTEAEAFNALLDALAERKGGESIVLPRGRHPNATASRRSW